MKKLTCLILCLMLSLTALSAFADGTVLNLGVWPEDIDADAVAVHESVYLPAFQEAMPEVEVNKNHYKYATDTFVAMAEAGTVPTVFETWYTEPQKLIKNGFVADITDELTELGWLDKMNPSIRTLMSDAEGRVYGIPRDGYALGLMINAEVFTDAGLVDEAGLPTYPKTWDEMYEMGLIIKEKTGSSALCLLAADNAGGWHFSNIAWTYGAVFQTQDETGKWTANLNTPAVAEAMAWVKKMNDAGLLTSDPCSENWSTGFAQLATGAAAMYIAANDAVNQPTNVNGLAADQLMMAGIPAGTDRAYSLSGGTPYMFSAKATHEEIMAALKYLEVMGKSPVLTESAQKGLIDDATYRVENGIPVINEFPGWSDQAVIDQKQAVVAEYCNIDMGMFNAYFDAVADEGNLKMEEPMETQDMYGELTKVLQAVITDKDADIQALLDTANDNFQKILDERVNN